MYDPENEDKEMSDYDREQLEYERRDLDRDLNEEY